MSLGDVEFDDGNDLPGLADTVSSSESAASFNKPVASYVQLADFLLTGYWQSVGTVGHHWAGNTVTYNLGNLNASEQALALAAMSMWHDVANVTFVSAASGANINFNHNGNMVASTGGSWNSAGIMSSATIDISTNWVTTYGTATADTYSLQTYIHEIGHALGLGHQGPYNGSATYGVGNVYADDTWQFSVMSYFGQSNYGGSSYRFVDTPMIADIIAIQSIYGAATTTRLGDTVYGFHSTAGAMFDFATHSTAPALTIYDSGGNDTLDASGYSVAQTIDLESGHFSSIGGLINNIGIAVSASVENAIGGSGADVIYGSSAANALHGGDGSDTLVGSAGADLLDGGIGEDTADYGLSTAAVWVDLRNGTGSGGDAQGDTLTGIEDVRGSAFHDALIGNGAANKLYGGDGNDAIWGGGGADLIDGGAGENTAFYDNSTGPIMINLAAGMGFAADAQGDVLVNIQDLVGSFFGDVLIGDAGANRLNGGGGNDWLFGGAGADVLDGGAGENTAYYDTSSSAVWVDLRVGTGSGGDAQGDILINIDDLVGSAFGDVLLGNDHDNKLSGGAGNDYLAGGAGADALDGGLGIDYVDYSMSPAGVSIDLTAGTGSGGDAQGDTLTGIEYVLGSAFHDTLTGDAGSNALLGGAGDDALRGNGGADFLDGGAGENTAYYDTSAGPIIIILAANIGLAADAQGDVLINIQDVVGSDYGDVLIGDAGANKLYGGAGNDWLIGGSGHDLLDGGAGQNTAWYDTSLAGVQVNLATGTGAGGDAEGDLLVNIQNVVGSNFGDVLVGDGNNNTINGAGGADVLSGGGGNDMFAFTPGSGQDVITDFTPHVGGGGNSNADVISLSGYGQFGVVDFASAQTHFSQVGSDVVISLSATDAITLKNVTLAQLHDADFLFG